jgi:hypothetical protein
MRKIFGTKRDEGIGEWGKFHSEGLHNVAHTWKNVVIGFIFTVEVSSPVHDEAILLYSSVTHDVFYSFNYYDYYAVSTADVFNVAGFST